MIDCTRFEKMFPEAVTGKLSAMEMAEFAEHRRDCPECASFNEADAYYRTRMQTIGFVPNVPPLPIAFQRDRKSQLSKRQALLPLRGLSLAAGMVLGVVLVGSFLFRTPVGVPGANGLGGNSIASSNQIPVKPKPQFADKSTQDNNAGTKDSIKLNTNRRIPDQFPGRMQQVSDK